MSEFVCFIEEGSYTPKQLANELTNKMNYTVSKYLINYLTEFFPSLLQSFYDQGCYSDFVVVYNEVSMKLWFGNKNSGFKINNDSVVYSNSKLMKNADCYNARSIDKYINWGLPWFLGFTYCNYESETPTESIYDGDGNIIYLNLPRFNYGNALNSDDGYWLLPTLTGANVYFIESPDKINIRGLEYFYMQINGLNNIDTTIPYNISNFTNTTNQTNGVVNNAFAKIPINSFPLNQCFDDSQFPHKYFNPPAERIRKIFINLVYHDGMPVFFGNADFSFTLELGLLTPQNKLEYDLVVPECTKYFS